MKKIAIVTLTLILFFGCITSTAFAAESEIIDYCQESLTRSTAVYNLTSSNYVTLSVGSLSSGSSCKTVYNYTTSTGKIVIRATGSASTTFKASLYTSSGSLINAYSVSVSSSSQSTITFSSLSTSTAYYIKFENTGSNASSFNGTIKAV